MKMLSFIMNTMFSLSARARSTRITHSLQRLILVALIGFWTPFVQATEPSFDALSHLLHTYAGPVDEKAAEAAPEAETSPESGARLSAIQADLSLMAEGFEAFRHPSHAQHALKDLPDHIVPELRPFFKDRDSTLDTVYRTLAVTNYTWALRFPEPTCDPRTRRKILLASKEGLFTDPKSGDLSPWLARLLGPAAYGRTAEEALDRASSKQALSARDYELLRIKVAKITEALSSDKAVGKERSKLYCLRAEVYETLASSHQATQGEPIQASRGTEAADLSGKEAASVLLIAIAEGDNRFRAVGAGVMVETPKGPKVLSDARLMPPAGEDRPSLRGFTRAKDGSFAQPRALIVERVAQASGIMVGRLEGGENIPTLKIARGLVARRDLLRAIGHMSASGAWTISQGLVTESGDGTFASDAILGPDMLGSPLLNDSGEVVGLVVLSPGAGAPAAVHAEHLRRIADGDLPAAKDLEFLAARQTGSASLLSTAMPLASELSAPGGGAIEAGLPMSNGGVNWGGGGGVGNWRPKGSAGRPSGSYSSSGSSSYSSYGSGKTAGTEIGEALAPLVEALIFKGIPALFRGIGSLFKSKPSVNAPAPRREIAQEQPRKIEKPPEPPKIAGLTLSLDRLTALEGERVTATALLAFTDASAKKDGIVISFSIDPAAKVTIADGTKGNSRPTDASGQATITYEISAGAKERAQPFDELKQEERRRAGEEPISQVRPQRKVKNEYDRVKAKMSDRFGSLDDEEAKSEDSEASADRRQDESETSSESLTQAALLTGPVPIKMETLYSLALKARAEPGARPVAPGAKLDDDKEAKVQSGACPTGLVAVMSAPEPPGGSPGSPAHIDPLKAKQLLECKEIEDRILAKCMDDLACEARELKQERYFERGCESRWRKLGGASPGSMGIPNIARRSGDYWCIPAKARVARGATIYSQGRAAPSSGSEDEGDAKKPPIKTIADLLNKFKDYVAVLKEERLKHILFGEGDGKGGGHKGGLGKSGKSEFPKEWSDAKVAQTIKEVANDPISSATPRNDGRIEVRGMRDGVDVLVIIQGAEPSRFYQSFEVITGYPTNISPNP